MYVVPQFWVFGRGSATRGNDCETAIVMMTGEIAVPFLMKTC